MQRITNALRRLRLALTSFWRVLTGPNTLAPAIDIERMNVARERRNLDHTESLAVGKILGTLPSTISDRHDAVIDCAGMAFAQLNGLIDDPEWAKLSPDQVADRIRAVLRPASHTLAKLMGDP